MELLEFPASPPYPRRRTDNGHLPSSTTSLTRSQALPPLTLSPHSSTDPISSTTSTCNSSNADTRREVQIPVRGGGYEILRLLRRKRNTSSSSDNDDGVVPKTPTSPEKTSPSRGFGFPKIGKIPLTPMSKSPKSERRSWAGDHLIHGKYAVTPKDKSVLNRISQRVHRRGSRVRKPHEVFVELEELRMDDEGLEWEETARWIKFEEDVEGKGWGRPHISALTFHSLVALRKTLESGCVLLDVEGEDFPTIVREIVQSLVVSGMLPEEAMQPVTQVLYMRHKHKSNVTLWEKLKKAATNRDNSSEGLKRRSSRASTDMVLREESEGGKGGGGGKGQAKGILRSHKSSSDQPKGSSLLDMEQQEQQEEEADSHSSLQPTKRVLFNLGSSSSLTQNHTHNHTITIESHEVANHTQPIIVESSVGIDMSDDDEKFIPVPNPPLAKTHHHGSSNNSSEFLKNWSELGLMDKIPEDAESLTVLVGGVKFLKEPVAVFVRLAQSHLLGDLTEVPVPVRFIYLLLGPQDTDLDYHEVGRAMATLMSDKHFHEVAYSALVPEDLLDGIDEFLDDSIVLPPGDWDENLLLPVMHQRNEQRKRKQSKIIEHEKRKIFAVDPIRHSRRPCGGMWADIKKLVKRYPSDLRDMLNFQVIISIIFLYITLVAPAVAFGGLMEEVTGNLIGETETLIVTGMAGVFYGLLAVQPLTIVAFTGPLLLFEEVVFAFSQTFDIPYLEWRAIIGLWLMLILAVVALSEMTFLVTYFSRFSDEIFTGIVSIFFAYEATKSLVKVFKRNPFCGVIDDYPCTPYNDNCQKIGNYSDNSTYLNTTTSCLLTSLSDIGNGVPHGFRVCNQPNTALWSLLLCFCTFFIALMLRKLRRGKFLGKRLRRLFSDFGMFTALTIMVLIGYLLENHVAIETLVVPSGYRPSCPSARGWFINPFIFGHFHTWEYFAAIIPAGLLAILIFVEHQLVASLVNKAEHKLTKEVGYHYDLLLVALLNGVCGILGIPWVCGTPVRSLQHVQALTVYSAHNAPGEKPRLLKVHEQRLTNVAVHGLILLTPLAYVLLEHIPIPVVMGVFYYLAYTSFSGVQMVKRTKLLFMPPKHHPDTYYVRKVRTMKMHLFTIIQLLLLAALWGLKLSPAGMIYPVAIVGLIPVRWLLGRFVFTHEEIEALDSEEDYPEDLDDGEVKHEEFDFHVPY